MQSRTWLGITWGFPYCGAQFIIRRRREKQRCVKYTSSSSVIRGRSWPANGTLDKLQKRACLQTMYTNCSHTAKWVAAAQAAVVETWAEFTSFTQSCTSLTLGNNHLSELCHCHGGKKWDSPIQLSPHNPSMTRGHLWTVIWVSRNYVGRFLVDNQNLISVTGTGQCRLALWKQEENIVALGSWSEEIAISTHKGSQ